jgi:hypothetical protein
MENNKYVQVRFESKKYTNAIGQILHNTRAVKPSYLRNNEWHNQFKNIYIYKNNDKNPATKYIASYAKTKQKEQEINNIIKEQLEEELSNVKSSSKSFRTNKSAIVIDSIITLSPTINEELKTGKVPKEVLESCFYNATTNLERKLGLEVLNAVVHYDEKTPHMHIMFKNYYDGKAISTKLKKLYSYAQDVVAKSFEEIGYTRGVKGSKTKHLTVQQMHIKEAEELQIKIEELKEEAEKLKEEIKELEQEKNNIALEEIELIEKLQQIKNIEARINSFHEQDEEINLLKEVIKNNLEDVYKKLYPEEVKPKKSPSLMR